MKWLISAKLTYGSYYFSKVRAEHRNTNLLADPGINPHLFLLLKLDS